MKKHIGIGIAILAFAATSSGLAAQAFKKINATLTGFEEVPAISTGDSGEFSARINKEQTEIQWELEYDVAEITQAHIHFGQAGVNGGVSVFLCSNLGNGPAGTQMCPASPSKISGTIAASNVIGPVGQGVNAGEFSKLLDAIRAGATYVNVHSVAWPGGAVRSQINHGGGGH